MFGIKFIKAQRTTYLLQYRHRKVVREGVGLSFFYYAKSGMAEHGVIFSDGIEKDFLEFNSGTQASIGIAERKGILVQ
jgi:hypothetical protein